MAVRTTGAALARRLIVSSLVAATIAFPAVTHASPTLGAETDVQLTPAAAASAEAARSGHRIEDVTQRTDTTQVFANPDGSWTREIAAEPVRAQDDGGTWHALDTTLVPDGDGFRPRYAPSDVVISGGGDDNFATLSDGDSSIAFTWDKALPEPQIDGSTATYKNVAPGEDLVVTATAVGFEHSLVINRRPNGPVDFTTGVEVDGARMTETAGGGAVVRSADGEVVAAIPRPVVYDSTGGVAGANAVAVDADLNGTPASGQELTVTATKAFLDDPDTKFPVSIDPVVQSYTSGDTWIQNQDFTSSQSTSTELRAGTYDDGGHVARTYMKFDDQNWSDKQILNADLVMYNFYSKTCNAHQITASRIYDSWSVAGLTWANKPSGGGEAAGFTPAYGAPSGSCGGGGYAHWDVTGIVNAWSHGSANNGIRLVAYNESNSNSWRRYYSDNRSDAPTSQPHINVTYNSRPVVVTGSVADPGGPGFTTAENPTLAATVADPDGGNVRARFEVSDGSSVIWTGTSDFVVSGGSASVGVPSGLLTRQTAYNVRVTANDGALDSANSVTELLVFDDGAGLANQAPISTPDEICELESSIDPTVGPCDSTVTLATSQPQELTLAAAQAANSDFVSAAGDESIAEAASRRPIYCTDWSQTFQGVTWNEKHSGRVCYDLRTNVWGKTNGAHHQCDQGSALAVDVVNKGCDEVRVKAETVPGWGYQFWDYFKVYVGFKGFPMSASYNMHLNVWPSGHMYFYVGR